MSSVPKNQMPFRLFRDFWLAVISLDFGGMGIRAVLTALIKMAPKPEHKLSLKRTAKCFELMESIHQEAMAGDQLAVAELVTLGTINCTMVKDVTETKPELVRPIAEVSVAWPIMQPYYADSKQSPQEQLRAIGFGEKAKSLGFRRFSNHLGMLALVLHVFRVFRKIAMGAAHELAPQDLSVAHAKNEWEKSALTNLDSLGKLSDLPLPEVNCLQRAREKAARAEVSGEIRYHVKRWFLALRPQVHSWLCLGKRPKQK